MTAPNLPPGFDPAIWKGWREFNKWMVSRSCKDGSLIVVRHNPRGVNFVGTAFAFMSKVGFSNRPCPQPEAAEWCQKYADEHGGFV